MRLRWVSYFFRFMFPPSSHPVIPSYLFGPIMQVTDLCRQQKMSTGMRGLQKELDGLQREKERGSRGVRRMERSCWCGVRDLRMSGVWSQRDYFGFPHVDSDHLLTELSGNGMTI